MKFTLGLFAILAIISLGQAHQFPDFGKGPLHEDFEDILDSVPLEKIIDVAVDYFINDNKIQDFVYEMTNTTVIRNLMVDFQAIPEVIKLVNYLHKEGINIYHVINLINEELEIKELVSSISEVYSLQKKKGKLRRILKKVKKHIVKWVKDRLIPI